MQQDNLIEKQEEIKEETQEQNNNQESQDKFLGYQIADIDAPL